MNKEILSFINKYELIPDGSTIIVGLSGGPDSVYLLNLLTSLKDTKNLKLIAAHLDHEWRADSSKDEEFCKELAQKYNVHYEHAKLSDFKSGLKFEGSQEEFGRQARRAFFKSLQEKYNADLIALAHHKQDQQENFFIRLLRGSSLTGLVGMKPKDGSYIRPLLETDKEALLAYLNKNSIPYLVDPSNESDQFLRNRIRSQVIPALRSVDPRFDTNFQTTLERLKEAEEFLVDITQEKLNAISEIQNGTLVINIPKLLGLPPYLQRRILMLWMVQERVPFVPTYSFLQEIVRFLKQPGSKKHAIHHAWKLVKKKDTVFIQKI